MAKILVVDDDAAIRRVVATILSLDEHTVVESSGGQDALRQLKRQRFDVVILDIMMPVMNGYEVLERMSQMPACADIPVVVLTAKQDAEGIVREAAAGAFDHVSKPFEPATLEEAVRRAMSATQSEIERRRQTLLRTAEVYSEMGRLREGFQE